MDKNVFSFSNFNVIQDNDNYYFFRCLEDYDIKDINNGKIKIENRKLDKLRTYRERYNETHDIPSRYTEDSQISLEEMWSHIKKNFYKGTNCISFSTNCNVSIDYDWGRNTQYLMIKVPKTGLDNVYSAGEYMLTELDNYIEKIISTISTMDDAILLINEIKKSDNNEEIVDIVSNVIRENDNTNLENLLNRFNPKQFFNYEQQLEYNRIIAKLTILEVYNKVDNILSRTNKNTSLISTISMAYSSGEVIVYKDNIPEDNLLVSKTIIDLFSILQQSEDSGINKDVINKLKGRVLEYAIKGYNLINEEGILYFGNAEEKIRIRNTKKCYNIKRSR